jgi:hypothetical protein
MEAKSLPHLRFFPVSFESSGSELVVRDRIFKNESNTYIHTYIVSEDVYLKAAVKNKWSGTEYLKMKAIHTYIHSFRRRLFESSG